MAKLNELIVTIGAKTTQFDKALGASMSKMRNFGRNTKRLGESMTRSLTMPIAGLGLAAVKSAADLEAMETSFISLTGGAKEAADMMQNLNEFTAKTPFQIEAVAKSARQLIASGTGINDVNEQLQFLGDIAATSGQPIDEIAAIFAKVNAKGKVELENLNQLAERGIPIFTALADATGLPADKLGAGAVSVEQFNDTLKGFATEGGFAAGAMERLSQTASGKFSTALDNLKLAGAALAQDLMPVVKDILDGFVNLMQAITRLSPETKKFALIAAGVAAALGPLLMVLPALLSPIGLVVGAVVALGIAIVTFADEIAGPLTKVINFFVTLFNESSAVRAIIGSIKAVVQFVFSFFAFAVESVIGAFTDLGKIISAILSGDLDEIGKSISNAFSNAAERTAEFGRKAAENFKETVEDFLTREPIELFTKEGVAESLKTLGGLTNLLPSAPSSGQASTAEPAIQRIDNGIPSPELIKRASTAVSDLTEGQANLNSEIGVSVSMAGQMESAFVGIGLALGGLITGTATLAEVFGQTIAGLANLLIDLGAQFIAAGVAATAFYANLIANPIAAIAAGVALVAAGAVIKGLQSRMEGSPPALAEGGLAFGPTLAMVGDNQGAGVDPEVIAPLSKLQGMMGGQAVQVTGKISGRDILLTSERNAIDRNRVRGF
tara:strand:+ start:2277 stop:4277 length:2001 start_codon:yes stop_codon:yes gene_type:complete